MKRIIIVALSFFFLLATAIPVISKDYDRDTHNRRNYKKRPDNPGRPDYKKRPDYHKHRGHKKRQDYHEHRGYRKRPYDKHRHYGRYDYKGHRYDYHGHWRSWEQWDRYARKHPHIYKHGRYYRENAHLMFKFCEPGTGNCFFFSIGR